MSAFSVGVFDGLSPLLTALWVSRDKSKGWKGISPFIYGLALIWYACRGICKQTIMFLICMKAYFLLFCPVTLVNLLNQCALLLCCMYVSQQGDADCVTFNPDSDLCHIRVDGGQ